MSILDAFVKIEREPDIDMSAIMAQSGVAPDGIDMKIVSDIPVIYEKAGLADTSKSIFKVDELRKTLPATTSKDTAKASVTAILGAVGIPVDGVISDADARLAALNGTLTAFNQETVSIIDANNAKIAELQAQIDGLNKESEDRKKADEEQTLIIKTEIDKVTEIVNFIK